MGFTDYGAPRDPSPGFDPNDPDLVRRRKQADQLAAMGMNRALAGRVAKLPPAPEDTTAKYMRGYGDDAIESLGYGPNSLFGGFGTGDSNPLPIVEEVTKVPGIHGAAGIGVAGSGATLALPAPKAPGFIRDLGLENAPDDEEAIARLGSGTADVYNLARQVHPLGRLLPEMRPSPRTQAILDRVATERAGAPGQEGGLAAAASTPGPNAPKAPGGAPEIGLTPDAWWPKHRMPQIQQEYAGALEGLGTGRHPGFEVGPPAGLAAIAGREVGPAGMRTEGGGVTSGVTAFDRPGGGTTYRSTNDDSIFATSGGQDTPEQHKSALAGLAARAFHPQTYDPAMMDVSEATHQKDLEGRQQDLAMRHMEAQIAREEAQARDPYGMGRFALEQAALNQRAQGRDQAGIERAMAADRTGLLERQDRESKAQKILAEYDQRAQTIDAAEQQIPRDAPPDDPRRVAVAQAREEAINKRNAAGAAIGVRFPEQ